MMRVSYTLFIASLLFQCSTKNRYDVSNFYAVMDEDSIRTTIVTYIFIPPPYTSMKDRFLPEHGGFYSFEAAKFSINKYFIADDGTNFFFIIRPGPKSDQKRGVGGHFTAGKNHEVAGFREVFVTPLMAEDSVKKKGGFLFDEMVKGDVNPYLKMKDYAQWPNPISYYDTITYEWKLIADSVK